MLPPLIFGPYVENYPAHTKVADLGTVGFVYSLIADNPDHVYPQNPFAIMADVRDVAKAVSDIHSYVVLIANY